VKICSFEGCGRPSRKRGLCGGHYQQKGPLKPLLVKNRPALPLVRHCSHCDAIALHPFKGGYYCTLHYRVKQMRYDAQASGKSVPTVEVLLQMIADLPTGMKCVVCDRQMNWLKADGHSTMATLQHDRDGGYRIICLGCNVRHQFYPGDSLYETPQGSKRCPSCGAIKPTSEFYPHNSNSNGLRSDCKPCSKKAAVVGIRRRRHANR
jgi:hypothetical protein